MKKIITLFAAMLMTVGLFAQTAKIQEDAESLRKNVQKGTIKMIMPESTEKADIDKSKSYYTDYFTVEYNPDNHLLTITMVDNTTESRRVIQRLLLSNNVRMIKVENKEYTLNDFYAEFLE